MNQKLRTVILYQKLSPGGWHPSLGWCPGAVASVCLPYSYATVDFTDDLIGINIVCIDWKQHW